MSISNGAEKFKETEQKVRKACNEMGRATMKCILEGWDEELQKGRDRKQYRHKGKRRKTLKTVFGEVEYERSVYETVDECGRKRHVYLLDEALGEENCGNMSALLSEELARASCEGTFRSAARAVSETTGQSISHTGVWNAVQKIGEQLDGQEKEAARRAAAGAGKGRVESKVLFEEQDGIWLSLQGKSRKTCGKSKEMKVAIAYDGAERTGKKRYRLTNKVACASFEGAEAFVKRKEGVIAGTFNLDEIEQRVLNGDGAEWIKRSRTDETVHFQLDRFHIQQAITRNVSDPEARKNIMGLLHEKKTDLLLDVIEAYSNSTGDEKEAGKYLELHRYLKNNSDGLIPYHLRGLGLPPPPEGAEYRRMGAMESNVFTIIGNRMKGRRRCWSIAGGENMARLLTRMHTGRLGDDLESLTRTCLPERYACESAILTAAKAPSSDGKGCDGFRHGGTAPPSTGYKWLRGLGALRPITEL